VVHLGGPAVVGTDYQPVGTSGPVPQGDTGEVITLPVSAGSGSQTYSINPVGRGTGAGDTLLLADVTLNTGPQQQQSVAFDYGGDLVLSPSAIACQSQAVVAIHDPEAVPVVSITPVNQTPAPDATPANADAYANWQDSQQPIEIPVEGQGDRTELHLHAALDQVFADTSSWQASLEAASGLDFWTSRTGGSPMTAAEFSAAEIDAGDYDGDVWVSQDAAYAGSPTPSITLDYQGMVGDPVYVMASATASTALQALTVQQQKALAADIASARKAAQQAAVDAQVMLRELNAKAGGPRGLSLMSPASYELSTPRLCDVRMQIDRWFATPIGDPTPGGYRHVGFVDWQTLETVVANLRAIADFCQGPIVVEPDFSPTDDSLRAYHSSGLGTAILGMNSIIYVCPRFWLLTPARQAGTLLHEISHIAANTQDYDYVAARGGGGFAPTYQKGELLDSSELVANADTYEGYYETIYLSGFQGP
jgi:hypothetical protein